MIRSRKRGGKTKSFDARLLNVSHSASAWRSVQACQENSSWRNYHGRSFSESRSSLPYGALGSFICPVDSDRQGSQLILVAQEASQLIITVDPVFIECENSVVFLHFLPPACGLTTHFLKSKIFKTFRIDGKMAYQYYRAVLISLPLQNH